MTKKFKGTAWIRYFDRPYPSTTDLNGYDPLGPGSRKRRAAPFVTRHEAVGVVFAVVHAGQPRLPARRVEGEGIPAMIAPSVGGHVRLLEHGMIRSGGSGSS